MSSYITFFVHRENTDIFIPIGEFSRSNEIYQAASPYVPYEKISRFNIDDVIFDLEKSKRCYLEATKKDAEYVETLKSIAAKATGDTLRELLDEIYSYSDNVERKEIIDEVEYAINYFTMLKVIEDEEYRKTIIYAGIEVGYGVTVENVVGQQRLTAKWMMRGKNYRPSFVSRGQEDWK